MNITKSQLDQLAKGTLGNTDLSIDAEYKPDFTNPSLELFNLYAVKFKDAIVEQIKLKEINATGKLADNIKLNVYEDGSGFSISMLDYYDFVNKGVKGVGSHKNAPASPYQYKNYGMPKSARNGLKNYIEKGRASISAVNQKKTTIGAEVKKISLIDLKVNTLVYLIKKFGIKTTNYFDIATESVAKDLGEDIMYLLGKTIVVQIGKPKKKKK
jgi:hypothetical protein